MSFVGQNGKFISSCINGLHLLRQSNKSVLARLIDSDQIAESYLDRAIEASVTI
jgi:hypothetical protein